MHVWMVERLVEGDWFPYLGAYKTRRVARMAMSVFMPDNPHLQFRVRKYGRV